MKEVTYTRYIADDGTMFASATECRAYEERDMGAIVMGAIHMARANRELIELEPDLYQKPMFFASKALAAAYIIFDTDAAAKWTAKTLKEQGVMGYPDHKGRWYWDGEDWYDVDEEEARVIALTEQFDRIYCDDTK